MKEVSSIQQQLTHGHHVLLLFRSRNLEDMPYLLDRAGHADWDHDAPVPLERGHPRDGRSRGSASFWVDRLSRRLFNVNSRLEYLSFFSWDDGHLGPCRGGRVIALACS